MKKTSGDPASEHLLLHLSRLAEAMTRPVRTEATQGRTVKRRTPRGYSYDYRFRSGSNTVGLFGIDVAALRELGGVLERISKGADARTLFRQNQRCKPTKTGEHQLIAIAYWSVRALNPYTKPHRALRKARSIFPEMELSDPTIKKLAQRYRDIALNFLQFGNRFQPFKLDSGRIIYPRSEEQVDALREYLRRKSARVDT